MIKFENVEIQVPQEMAKDILQSAAIKNARHEGFIGGFCACIVIGVICELIFGDDDDEK